MLSEGWASELRGTVRPQRFQQVASSVKKALDAYAAGDFDKAVRLAEEAKADAPRSGRVRELLGLSYYRAERWHDALRELLTYKRFTGRKDQNHVIADCYRADGRYDKAFQIINEVSPNMVSPEVWSELMIVAASILSETGDIEKALYQLIRADTKPQKVETHHLRLWYVRADLLERAGRTKEAQRDWEAIYAEDPDFFDVGSRLRK
jgi:tetratricopeptide (TPR) repeat protein